MDVNAFCVFLLLKMLACLMLWSEMMTFPIKKRVKTDLIVDRWATLLYSKLAEVPGAAWANLQPAEHLKNVFFSFNGFKPPRPRGEGAGSNLRQNFPWTGWDVRGKFHHDWRRGLDFH